MPFSNSSQKKFQTIKGTKKSKLFKGSSADLAPLNSRSGQTSQVLHRHQDLPLDD